MNPNKPLPNYAILFLLTIAFLTMQWTSVHIHLVEHHSHDGIHHEHQSKTHAHSLLADTDVSHQANHVNSIEFEQNYLVKKHKKQKTSFDVIAVTTLPPSSSPAQISNKKLVITSATLAYCCYSTLNPRAPPKTS
ncbi:MAG: hypothetical protein Q9O24_04665 [Gammaproteobacteria bacterium]|nr:hypothetical protein [Gammaproteobacteria bacterium]